MTLEDLIAHHRIRDLLMRFCRAVDRGDRELLKSVYHPDGFDDHGPFKGPGRDFADYVTDRYDDVGAGPLHHMTSIYVELDGDRATGESGFIAWSKDPAVEHGFRLLVGRYLDAFERHAGEWKIRRRNVIVDHAQPDADGKQWDRLRYYLRPGRREADPTHGQLPAMDRMR